MLFRYTPLVIYCSGRCVCLARVHVEHWVQYVVCVLVAIRWLLRMNWREIGRELTKKRKCETEYDHDDCEVDNPNTHLLFVGPI